MRQAGFQGEQTFSKTALRGLWLAAIVLGIGLAMSGPVRAGDDDDEDMPEPSLMDNIMSGIGAKPQGDEGIKYRERSPLVVPSKIELPPPASKKIIAPNWPKDPDEIARKEAIAASKKSNTIEQDYTFFNRALSPSELNAGRNKPKPRAAESMTPGGNTTPLGSVVMMSPSQLGYKGGLFNMFGGNVAETAPFTGEPERQTLMQPPAGYQTPSPNFAYGAGPRESLVKEYNPAAGKYGNN